MKKSITKLIRKKANLLLPMTFSLLPLFVSAADKVINVKFYTTGSYVFQHIDGFGGCGMSGQWADVYNGNQTRVNKLWGQGDDQIGLNIMRIRINPNESSWGEYGNPIKYARQVCPDLQVFATPWTPPKKYKTSKTTKYQNEFGTWVWPLVEHSWGGQGSNGGTICDDSIPSFANFLERYRATMEKKGCPVDIISMQNECDYTPTATDNGVEHASYESCIYSPNQMAKMVKAARAAIDPKCKVMGPETFGWGQANYNTTLANNADAVANIDLWGNHQYGSNDYSFVNTVTKKTGKHMWMTEFLWNYGGDDYKSDFGSDATYTGQFKYEYRMINSINTALIKGYNGYVYYNMNDDFFASAYGGDANTLGKRAWVFGHYAKYATGKTRIQPVYFSTSYSKNLSGTSAFISESGDTLSYFVLNPTTENYTLNITAPFTPAQVKMVVTNDAVNRKVIDITDRYDASAGTVTATLLAGSFYTFVFERADSTAEEKPATIATSYKKENNVNPICPFNYIADVTAIEHDGRLYIYGTNDQQQYDYCDGLATNNYGKITQLVCLSTNDMANWTFHGTIDVKALCPWIGTSWAPSIVSRVGTDGQKHFYMYFTNGGGSIGVLTADSPLGPWKDPLGKALISGSTPGLGSISSIIDPGAVVDTVNNRAYLAFGGGGVQNDSTSKYPGNARIVELNEDMISFKSNIINVQAPYHFEANELNMIGGKIAYSYCSRWDDPSAAASMRWIMADSITGKWTSKTIFFKNPGQNGYPYGNNHTHIQKFNGTNYLLYHTQALENANGLSAGYRNLAIDKITINESQHRITALTPTDAGASVITENLPVMGTEVQAETFGNAAGVTCDNDAATQGNCFVNVKAGSWMELRKASFPAELTDNMKFTAKVQGTGTMEVRLDDIDSTAVATLDFDNADMQEVSTSLGKTINELSAKAHNIFLVFTKTNGTAKIDSWKIAKAASTGDVNGDGSVDISDVNAIISVICGNSLSPEGERVGERGSSADVNGDGTVDISDVNYVIGIICGE